MTEQETIEAMRQAFEADLGEYHSTNGSMQAAYYVARKAIRNEMLKEVFAWREDVLDREEGFDQMINAMKGKNDE